MSPRFIHSFIDLRNVVGFAAAGWRNRDNAAAVIIDSHRPAKKFSLRSAMAGTNSSKLSAGSLGSNMPDFRSEIRGRLMDLGLSPAREAEIADELVQHHEDEYEQALSRGLSEDEAERAVLADLNVADSLGRELKRVERRVPQNPVPMGTQGRSNMIGDLGQDVRYGLRMLAKNPAFTTIAVLALALGIGANSAIFSVVNAILLRPLPYKNPEQLMMVWENATHLGFPKNTPSPANFLDWRRQTTVFESMAAFAERSFNLTGVGEPERLDGRRVSANLFGLLGVRPIIGRTFVPQEDQPGTKVVLLNESLWKRRFGGDPSVIGRALTLNNESYTVVGVLPRSVRLPAFGNWRDQVWVPLAFPAEARAAVRHKEIALRLALGADRARLTKQLLVESVMLSLLGGVVGLGFAYAGLHALTRFIPHDIAHADTIAIDGKVLVFTFIIAIV